MADTGQQTEKATPRRLEKARKEGNFPAAREFVSAVQFFAFVAFGTAWFPVWVQSVQSALSIGLREAFSASLTSTDLFAIMGRLSAIVLRPLATLGLILLAI